MLLRDKLKALEELQQVDLDIEALRAEAEKIPRGAGPRSTPRWEWISREGTDGERDALPVDLEGNRTVCRAPTPDPPPPSDVPLRSLDHLADEAEYLSTPNRKEE